MKKMKREDKERTRWLRHIGWLYVTEAEGEGEEEKELKQDHQTDGTEEKIR
jgi:hypothetical protein